MLPLYNKLLLPFRLALGLRAAMARSSPESRTEWAERRARRLPVAPHGGAWIHGASVGEARIVTAVAGALRRDRPGLSLAVSALTPTGRRQLPAPPDVDAAFYLPLDFRGLPARVLAALQPSLLTLVETELWPNLVHEALACGAQVAVVNGRLSARRMQRYRRWSGLYGPLVRSLSRVGAQSEQDAERFVELGLAAERVEVTGNVKYDLPAPSVDAAALRGSLGIGDGRPVLVAGSTGAGEEQPVLDAFGRLRESFGDVLLLIAPRHPERAAEVERTAVDRGFAAARRSSGVSAEGLDVLVVDTLGELTGLYAIGFAAFVGGSLVPLGGHNVLEPAAAGIPVIFGPHTDNVVEPAAALERAGGARRVADAEGLARAAEEWLRDGAARLAAGRRAAEVVRIHRGALRRTLLLIERCLDDRAAAPGRGAA